MYSGSNSGTPARTALDPPPSAWQLKVVAGHLGKLAKLLPRAATA